MRGWKEKRSKTVKVCLTEPEHLCYSEHAKRRGLTLAQFVRMAVFSYLGKHGQREDRPFRIEARRAKEAER